MDKIVVKKILLILFIIICIFSLSMPKVYATGNPLQDAEDFLEKGKGGSSSTTTIRTIDQDKIKDVSDIIYNVLLGIAVVIAIGVGIFIGIQFVLGSVEAKAKIKETLIPYFAGCIVIFGAFGIWKLIVTLLQN